MLQGKQIHKAVREKRFGIGRSGKKKLDWDEVESYAYGELGLVPQQYHRLTYREFVLLKEGRERVIQRQEMDNWHRTRLLAYVAGKPYFDKKHQGMTVYEFMPLPGDPTEQELKEIRQQQKNQEEKEALQVIDMYKKMGYIGKNAVVN